MNVVRYPNIVTLSQIYSMISQRLIEDGVILPTADAAQEDEHAEVEIDPITHQPVVHASAVARASIRASQPPPAPSTPLELEVTVPHAPSRLEKAVALLWRCVHGLEVMGKHYVYRSVLLLLLIVDTVMTLLSVLGFVSTYRLS